MNGRMVGILDKLANGSMTFQYDQTWLATPGARPISISMSLRPKKYSGDVVYNFFENLLTDNPKIKTRIQQRFQLTSNQPFDLLEAIGNDCVGALQICGPNSASDDVDHVAAEPMNAAAIESYLRQNLLVDRSATKNSNDFRVSLAGAQEKTALLKYKGRWCRPLKNTATSHIFKLPMGLLPQYNLDLHDSCENEWLCLKISELFGLPTAKAEIKQFGSMKTLIIERFDRRWSKDGSWLMRLPQEDMCQALGYSTNLKYQSDGGPGISKIMDLLLGSQKADVDRSNFFKAQILFWLLAAPDGHAKNFSIYILPDGRYQLTPFYDMISFYPYFNAFNPPQKLKMAMCLRGKSTHYYWNRMLPRHFESTARTANFSDREAAILVRDMLEKTEDVVDKVRHIIPAGFPDELATKILDGMFAFAKVNLKKVN
jgi:serine/threonine-protein kinase HipA